MKEKKYSNPNEPWYYQQKLEKSEFSFRACVYSTIAIIILILIAAFFCGCKSIQYVPVETVKTEYVNKTDTFIQKDSVVYHDSVYIHARNDTVYFEKWHTKYKDKIVTKIVVDSFIKTDSIQVPYPVERKLTRWEKVKMDAGGIALIVCLLIVLLLIGGLILKRKS